MLSLAPNRSSGYKWCISVQKAKGRALHRRQDLLSFVPVWARLAAGLALQWPWVDSDCGHGNFSGNFSQPWQSGKPMALLKYNGTSEHHETYCCKSPYKIMEAMIDFVLSTTVDPACTNINQYEQTILGYLELVCI